MAKNRTFRYPFIRKKQQRREIMWHNFEGEYLKEGNRHFLKIPFNMFGKFVGKRAIFLLLSQLKISLSNAN